LCRFLHDVVCLTLWIFLYVSRATYEMCVRGKYVAIPNPLDLVHIYEFLWKYLLDPKDLLLDDALAYLRGNPVLTYDPSAMCQDPNLFLPEADSKDPVVPVCHHHTPASGYLANCAT
jgi:hypothetical protein